MMVDLSGTENRNRSRFHGCRQDAGESVLTFAGPVSETANPVKPEIAEVDLPSEFVTEIKLTTPIDSGTASIGDQIEARLVRNPKDHGRLAALKGATLKGRIARLEKRSKSYAFAFSFYLLEFAQGRAALTGREDSALCFAPGC